MNGIHHIHKRKRVHKKLEVYPHENKWVRFLDRYLIVIAVIGPLMTLPQIWSIFVYKNAMGVSALTWGLYTISATSWIIYGVVHKEKPIIIANVLWLIVEIVIVIGALIY